MPPRATIPVFGAAAGAALLGFAWFATFHIGVVEHADLAIFRRSGDLGFRAPWSVFGHPIFSLCNEAPYGCLCAVPVFIAIARRRLWLVLEVGLVLVGANVTTQVLKHLLAHPRAGMPPTSWPSGHTTAATSLALCCVLVAPARLRAFVAAGASVFVVGVGYSLLVTDTHYPSDVVAGVFVACIWGLLGDGLARAAARGKSAAQAPAGMARRGLT